MALFAVLRRPGRRDFGLDADAFGADQEFPLELAVEDHDELHMGELREDPEVELFAEDIPVSLINPFDDGQAAPSPTSWGLDTVKATSSSLTGSGTCVAVLDTGIDGSHPAFAGLNPEQRDFTGTGNGDRHGHGTHCAGTIFGRDVGGVRIGVARGVDKALIGKVLDDRGRGSSVAVLDALQWAHQSGAHIISMSLGFDYPRMVQKWIVENGWPEDLATDRALAAYRANLRLFDAQLNLIARGREMHRHTLVVAATGNSSRRKKRPDYVIQAAVPAAAESVLSVAAVGQAAGGLKVADFSNTLPVVAAPGVNVLSAALGGGLKTMSGTSMACPHAAGIAALWRQRLIQDGQTPTADRIRLRMLSAATQVGLLDYNVTDLGEGLVQAP